MRGLVDATTHHSDLDTFRTVCSLAKPTSVQPLCERRYRVVVDASGVMPRTGQEAFATHSRSLCRTGDVGKPPIGPARGALLTRVRRRLG